MFANIHSNLHQVEQVDFLRHKYGQELLVDVAWIAEMPAFINRIAPYYLSFYDITLVTSGQGSFWLDNQEHQVQANQLFFSTPGQIRRWFVQDLQGICLFFPAEFLLAHFKDPLFLHRLRYFHTSNGPFSLQLSDTQAQFLSEKLVAMQAEIQQLQSDSSHLLRAYTYESLLLINRWYTQAYGQRIEASTDNSLSRFRSLLEESFRQQQGVSFYADQLGLTAGHLNYLCKQHLGQTAGQVIRNRVMAEACRLLAHSELDVNGVGHYLGYKDPSYFNRVFKRQLGFTPSAYRKSTYAMQT